MTNFFPLNELPVELLSLIFKFLPVLERIRFCRVSTQWSELILSGVTGIRFHFGDPFCPYGRLQMKKYPSWTQISRLLTVERLDYDDARGRPYGEERKIEKEREKERKITIVQHLVRKLGTNLRKFVYNDHQTHSLNEKIWTSLVDHCPNIICLKITQCSFKIGYVRSLLQTYGHQLEELELAAGLRNLCTEKVELVVEYVNPDRLRKLHLAVESSENLEMLCDRFPNLFFLFLSQNIMPFKGEMSSLAKLKRLHTLIFEYFHLLNLRWAPVQDWRHSLVELHIRNHKFGNLKSNLFFIKEMILLRRLTIRTESQDELDFVCQNVSPELEYFNVTMIGMSGIQVFTRFPDICRLEKLQSLTITGMNDDKLFNSLRLLDQNLLPSVRKLTLNQLSYGQESPQMLEFISKMNSVFPNLKHFGRCKKKGHPTLHFW